MPVDTSEWRDDTLSGYYDKDKLVKKCEELFGLRKPDNPWTVTVSEVKVPVIQGPDKGTKTETVNQYLVWLPRYLTEDEKRECKSNKQDKKRRGGRK